jgi:phosphatidylglycerophosphatase C
MSALETAAPRPWIAVFDLDGTLTFEDTLLLFLATFLRRHPRRLMRLWRAPFIVMGFLTVNHDRGTLKSRVIRMVMGGADRGVVDADADSFVSALKPRHAYRSEGLARLEAHRAAGDHLVLLSASPDIYVPRIGRALGFELTLCTEIRWIGDVLDGALVTANRRGAEKSRCLDWLRTQYPGLPIAAYANSASDLDHMRRADRALLVNGNAAARALAEKSHIPTAVWT